MLEELLDDEDELRELNLSSRPRREMRREQRERARLERELERCASGAGLGWLGAGVYARVLGGLGLLRRCGAAADAARARPRTAAGPRPPEQPPSAPWPTAPPPACLCTAQGA